MHPKFINRILMLLIFSCQFLHADGGIIFIPIKPRPHINFQLENNSKIDSITIFLLNSENKIDTTYTEYRKQLVRKFPYYNQNLYNNRLTISRYGRKIIEFKLKIYIKNNYYNSDWIKHNAKFDEYSFFITKEGKLIDNSTIFHTPYKNYLYYLIFTILSEVVVLFLFIFKKSIKKINAISTLILLNLITHPFFYIINTNTEINGLILELIIILLEALGMYFLFRKHTKLKFWLIISFIWNLFSVIVVEIFVAPFI